VPVRTADQTVQVEAVIDALPSPTVLLAPDGTVLLANSAWTARNAAAEGSPVALGVGGNYFETALRLFAADTVRTVVEALGELSRGERETVAVDCVVPEGGASRWFHLQASRVAGTGQVVLSHTDITARVLAERSSSWRARHDHLTELPNRAHLHELIDEELARPDRGPVAVLFLDCDGFKEINDSLGHEVGDELLRQVAARLAGRTRAGDTVGRLGGDEFVVLCRDCDTAGAEALAARFRSAFDEPFALGPRTGRLTASIGIATTGPDDVVPLRSTDLVRDADLAMYAAKAAGRNRVRTFTADLRYAAERRALLAGELHDAIEQGRLVLHYQPIMYLPTGECSGVEALVRWRHPERGLLMPGEWLDAAERQDLVAPLARWVLGEATRQTAAWAARGLQLVTAVNVSASHFATGTLVDDVAAALAAAGLPPEQLLIELTETSVAADPERAAEQFAALRLAGVEVSLDDFGSGWSSISQLINIPTGVIKIDRGLVAGVEGRAGSAAAAISAVVGLAAACGARTLAEGVETAEQLALAAQLGCSFAQGYHIARPMPAEALETWMSVWRKAPRLAGTEA
jgi:diguanylate cyclase (GGDEF)-like protein